MPQTVGWQLKYMQQQQQCLAHVGGHAQPGYSAFGMPDTKDSGGSGFKYGLGTGLGFGLDIFGAPLEANSAAAAATRGGCGEGQRPVRKRAAQAVAQSHKKRSRVYRKQMCQQCWNPRAADQPGGRPGKAAHHKWGAGSCELPCAVCSRPMQQHRAPCAKPAE